MYVVLDTLRGGGFFFRAVGAAVRAPAPASAAARRFCVVVYIAHDQDVHQVMLLYNEKYALNSACCESM